MNAPDASAAEGGDPNPPEVNPADEFEKTDSLCPNRTDIDRHLFELFSPVFVHPYPDAWIEIAYADPASGGKPDQASHFSAFDLAGAAKFAEVKNKAGFNIYVGAALRQGKTTSKSKGRASGANFLAASHAWAEFDKQGDDVRIEAILKEKNLQTAITVVTGRTPNLRAHLYFKLAASAAPEELKDANAALMTLLGSDDIKNPDRLMRLAGTINYPTPKKTARGYVAELVTLRLRTNARVYQAEELIGLTGKQSGPFGFNTKTGRDDSELRALLDASRVPGQWHNSMRAAIATMVGRGWSDTAIKRACAACCRGGADDPDLVPLIAGARKKWNKPNEERNAEIERLARLSLLEYDQQRKKAAEALGIRVPMLDRMVGAARHRHDQEQLDQEKRDRRDQEKRDWHEREKEYGSKVAQINAEHALVLAGDKASVMKFEGVTKFRLLQVGALKQWFANQSITVGKKVIPLGEYWLSHPQRRQYEGIEFAPSGSATRPGYYNLWQGFAIKPKEGDCSKFLAHLKDNVARGDEKTYLWIVGWFAQILQQPAIKMETALVLRGQQGTGKSKIGQVMGALIGHDHYISVASPRYITGQFNSHMASLLLLHADEAFWAGDKKSEGTLKDLVTGLYHLIEYKGVDPIRIKNYIRLFVTGNPDWLIPAGSKERRWAVFDMGEDHMQDKLYFAAIDEEMNNGGREALMHYLLNFDLSQVDLRSIPKTAALLDQQIESLTPEQSWWLDTLTSGVLPPRPPGVNELHTFLKAHLYQRYVRHAQIQGANHRAGETRLGIFLRAQLGPGLKNKRATIGTYRLNCYELPSLRDCRRLFAKMLGQTIEWGAPGWETEQWQHDTYQQSDASDWDPDTGDFGQPKARARF